MSLVRIEFFHDVICSFCFPLSYRMRLLAQNMPDVKIVHRSFALVKTPDDFNRDFGSRENAKQEILTHWQHANRNDDLNRFNIEGMRAADFPFPSSMNALLACKAAFFIGADALYWDLFDGLQKKLFVENRNIESIDVIEEAVAQAGIDIETWRRHFSSADTRAAVDEDLRLADVYHIHSVPTLIVAGERIISGAQSLDEITTIINAIMREKSQVTVETGACCRMVDGKMQCG